MAEEPVEKVRRLVRNPETFRERAIKAAEGSDKPKRAARVKQAAGRVAAPVFTPIGSASRSIFGRQPFVWFRKPLRLVGRVIFPVYFRNSWRELRLVAWPGWRESRRLTFAVLIFAVIFGAAIAIVDYGLDKVFRAILLK